MAFSDWLKEYRETQGTKITTPSQNPTVSSTASKTSTSVPIGSGDFRERLKKYREHQATSSVQGWAEISINLVNDIRNSSDNWYDEDEYKSRSERFTSLLAQADNWRKQYIGDDEAVSYIDSVVDSLSKAQSYSYNSRKYYSQWETAEDYVKYKKEMQDYEDKKNFDLQKGQKEIEDLKAKRFAYANNHQFDLTDHAQREAYDKAIAEMSNQITQKEQYLNQAKRIQEGVTLSAATENADFKDKSAYVSTYEDGTWSKLTSDYGLGYQDLTYEYINNQNGIRDEIKQKHIRYSYNAYGNGESIFEQNGYDYMTENEVAIYNYYYAKEGKDKAQEYLDSIQETLNIRKATSMYEEMEDNTALELAFGVAAGLDQFKSGLENVFNTEDDYIAQTAYQVASGMVRQDLADNGAKLPDWLGGASLGQVAYDAITTGANMAPSILASVGIGILNPVAVQIAGNVLMGASAAGNAYQEALNQGYNKGQARTYSTMVGASEAVLGQLLGGISKLGGTSQAVTNMLNGVDNAFLRFAAKMSGSMFSEGLEEGLQEVLTPMFSNFFMNTDKKVNWSEVAYSALLGAMTAGIMEGPTTISGEVGTYQTGKQLQAADISAQRLAEIGQTFSADTVAYQLAGRVNENTGAYTMGRLFNEIGATLSEQNVNDITNALVAKGMDSRIASKNAKALAYVVEGGQLSDRQIAMIEANEVLAEAARTTLVDANTTWNQRSKGYNEALMALAREKASPNASRTNPAQQGEDNTPASDKVDAENKKAAEGSSEADIPAAKVQSIATIKDGQVTVKMDDGSEVDIAESGIDPEDGMLIETIAKIGAISSEDANFILGTLKAAPGVSAQVDSLGAREAYQYGFYGFSQDHIAKHGVFANSLTESQRQAIYETGRKARAKQTADKQATVSKKETVDNRNETVDNRNATDAKKVGKVHFDGDRSKLTNRQKASLTAMEKVADIMGVQIHVFESKVGANGKRIGSNGWYDPVNNSIHIDLHAGANGEGTMLFTLSHELTHHIRKWSPEKFKILSDFLMEEYGKKGVNVNALVLKQQEKAKRVRNVKLSYDTAWEEVVADSMETMLADGNVLNRLEKLKAKDKDLWYEIKRFINDLADKIRAVYKGMTPDSVEGRMVADMGKTVYRLQELFTDALYDASENFQSAEKNTTDDGGVNHDDAIKRSERIVDQIRSNLPQIMALDSVSTIDATNASVYTADRKKDAKSGAAVFMAQGGVANRAGFGRVVLGKRGAVHTVQHGNGPAKQAAFPAIKAVIERGIEIYRDDNHEGRGYDTITFSAPITFFEEKAPLAVVVKSFESVNADKTFYIHEICDAEGNYIQLAAEDSNKKTSSTNFVEPTSTVSAANGIAPKTSIRNKRGIVKNESTETLDMVVDAETESIAPAVLFSERTWTESDYVQERDKAAKEIAKAIGVSEKKAKAYIDSVNSIAKMIADDRVRLDYFSSPGRSSFVGNVEYGGSFDFSTLCKKRRLLTGTFTAIQKALPNTALTADEILDIRNRMKDAGLEVSCGLCYVEGSRANMGQFAKEFLKLYKQYYPDAWQPNMADVNTPDGIEWVRINHPECYEQYEYFWNHYGTMKDGDKNLFASQQKPKLYQLHTEYKGEILQKFKDDDNVEEKNLNGGIRLQSFSDFEIVHLIDTMQIIMDMSRVGLAGQAYTKVPDFAWALGDTGLKINLSLIAKGVDENGKLIFDDVEGMPIADAMKLRDRYSANVGTILVAFNDEQLIAAMADDRVDYIIPFHRSQWKKSQYGAMGLPAKTKDYTYMQNEKFIKPQYHEYRGRMVKDKATNYMPNEYWDFSKSGKENAEAYLEMCSRNNKRPKFYKLLQNNGDGSYSLKADGSTDGYWKLLIDFKMYDNDGNGSPQMPVKPEFNMEEATRMLDTYSGGHSNFPVAQGIVDEFVQEYKESHKGVLYSDRDATPTFYSHMARVVDGVKQEKLGAASVVSMLRGKGVKAEEIKWSGIEAFLEGKKSVTKSELQEFVRGSMLQIEEQTLGETIQYTKEQTVRLDEIEKHNEQLWEEASDLWDKLFDESMPYEIITSNNILRSVRKRTNDADLFNDDAFHLQNIARQIDKNNMELEEIAEKARLSGNHAQWGDYKLDGGENYREILFKIPKSSYSNSAMSTHWGFDNRGVLVHARMQDLDTSLGKMLFIEEIQSDWHNEGHKTKYQGVPDAPFSDTYHEYVLKRLLRMAAEQDYDSIGWTPAEIQVDRWSKEFEKAYRIEYDQEVPKFLNRYGKKWGTKVGKTVLDSGTEVWSMAINDEMKESVLTDGQPLYSERDTESVSNRSLLANVFEGVAQNDIEKKRLQEYKGKISLIESEERKLSELNEKIKELSFAKGPKDTKKIRDLQFEAKQTANRISTYDKQLLRLEASKPLQNVLEREKKMAYKRAEQKGKEALDAYKERAAKTQRELLDRYQNAREQRKRSFVRSKIKSFKERLESSLLKPTDRRYVPIDLIKAMVEVCGLIDTDTELYNADGSINKAQEKRNLTKEKLQDLKDEYEKLKTHSDPIYAGEFDEMVYAYLTELRDNYSGKHLNEMSLDELNTMYEILRAIEETLQDARKLIGWGDAETVYEAGDAIVAEQDKITKSRKGGKRNAAQKARDASLNLSLSPVRNVERMSGYHDDSSLLKLFKKFEQGIRKKNKFVMEAYKSFETLTSSKKYDDAIYTEVGEKKYEDVNGRKFGISKMQMMQAILSHEREAANGMHHIEGSGFSFADLDMLRKGRLRDAISEEYSHRVPTAVNLVAEFSEILKDDQWCQDYMKAARKFFNGTAKDAINETSIALKHRIIAKDKSYIPFEVDKNFVVREISAENDIQQTINSYGMLKDTKKGASQPLIITGLNNILDRHIDQVGNVYGLAIEVRNFNKVWNVRSLDAVGNDPTVKAAIQRNWGIEGVKHIEQAVQDIQGPRHNDQSALYKKVKSGYIGATFLFNLSVVTKQIGSLYSATSMLKWRGPVRMVGNLVYTMVDHKRISAEVDKYTATAWMRRQGLSDAELHTFMTEGKKSFIGRLTGKLPAVINPGKWITAMDSAVALSLWRYAKIDTAKRTGLKGEELLKATAEFYDEVIENTQSMTDVLHRPEIQKRSDIVSESLGMFKTDLYQMAGQLQVTAGRFTAKKTKANGMALGRTVYAIAMSAVWAQLMTTVFALLRYKVNQYRDDEDEDLTKESWLKRQGFSFAGDLIGYILPIFGSEIVGVFENIMYGESEEIVDSLALTAINDLYDAMITVASAAKEGEMIKPADLKKLTTKALQVFGIPANNILRTYEAIQLHAKDIANGEFLSFEAGVNRSPKHHIHRIVEAMVEGKTSVAIGLYEEAIDETAMEKSDDGSYGDDELEEAKSSLKSALGDKYKDGEISKEQVTNVLVTCFGMDKDEAKQTIGKWDFKIKYDYAWTDRGDAYLDGTISAMEFKKLLMDIGGKTAEEADEYIEDLDFEEKHGFTYSERDDAYKSGEISASELRHILMDVGGKTEEEADLQIQAYDWQAEGYEGATAAAVRDYNEYCANAGVPKDVYLYIRKVSNNTENDVDANGKTIYYSAMRKVMAEIGAQAITPAQKYAIARSLGWAEKNIQKYRTW